MPLKYTKIPGNKPKIIPKPSKTTVLKILQNASSQSLRWDTFHSQPGKSQSATDARGGELLTSSWNHLRRKLGLRIA